MCKITTGTASGIEPMPSYENPSSTALISLAIITRMSPAVLLGEIALSGVDSAYFYLESRFAKEVYPGH